MEVTHKNAISLRENIASVSQGAYLFDADVLFNLTLGKEKDMDEIHNVLRLVGLRSFIKSLPDGLHTHLGPNGFSMSGGEKVRLCLARAMLMDRKMRLGHFLPGHAQGEEKGAVRCFFQPLGHLMASIHDNSPDV